MFPQKTLERIGFLFLQSNVFILKILVKVSTVAVLVIKIFFRPTKEILFFSFFPKTNIGYTLRYEPYLQLLANDNYTVGLVMPLFTELLYQKNEKHSPWKNYFLHAFDGWYRFFQIFRALHYKQSFVHRGLFPFFTEIKQPIFEPLLATICPQINIDYWDSVFEKHRDLFLATNCFAQSFTVSNSFLKANLPLQRNQTIDVWEIGVELHEYEPKKKYDIGKRIKLVWAGNPNNLTTLKFIEPVLQKLNSKYPLELIIICNEKPKLQNLTITHFKWDSILFGRRLAMADIGIYPEKESVHSKGKSAMKILDYFATALPVVAVPYGAPEFVKDGNELLFCTNEEEWYNNLEKLILDIDLRKRLGTNGRAYLEEHHAIEKNYQKLKTILVANN